MLYTNPVYQALAWSLILPFAAVNAALTARNSRLHTELMENAPPGITYRIPQGTRSWTSSSASGSRVTTTGKKLKPVHVQKLHPVRNGRINPRSAAVALGAHQRRLGEDGLGYENISSTNAYGTQYSTDATWDGTPLRLLLDTGSSDTWAAQQNFTCQDFSGHTIVPSACGFASPQISGFKYGLTDPIEHMYIQYGDSELVAGPMGFSDVSVGNLTVKKQQVCLVNRAYWFGNNMTSGLLGMAYPSLTNAYLGDKDEHSHGENTVEYSPFFTSLVEQGQIDPVFSIAIDRNASTGVLALGGIPTGVSGLDRGRTVSLDMIITNLINDPDTAAEPSFYTIIPDGWYYDQTTNAKKYPYIVDSGTTLCYLPPKLAQQINQAFNPPGVYLWMYGSYFTACNARVVPVAIILNGIKFWFNPKDLIYRDVVDPMSGLCMTAIASGGTGPYILGDVFMQNALTIFDVGDAKMRFVPRIRY
ncbi:aspartic peptidase domain-containing protein [Podospora fimiseda]|uniref:Aspartic peptidase domain-containing protein n=1 Tax=Podospora fimiseda TaxID=252190 RepID=A0AAN7BRE6_9PEZI|nr:aspartic peptidase domain-containing protein [Podospora fimiseda]